MKDPYRVLGVAPTASEDEIKKAYRKLSRMYHPDSNMNKSESEKKMAEEKFKEVQTAYEDIIDGKVNPGDFSGNSSSAYGPGSSRNTYSNTYRRQYNAGGSSSSSYNSNDVHLEAAANFIANGYLREARNILDNIDPSTRTAKWYYYSAIVYARIGQRNQAIYHARAAASMEPSNSEYSVFYDYLTGGNFTRSTQDGAASYTGWYNDRRNTYGYGASNVSGCCNTCINLVVCASCFGC